MNGLDSFLDLKSVVARQGSDIDKAHERVRVMSSDIEMHKSRLMQIDNRIAAIEARISEQREILSKVNEHVLVLKSTQDALMMTVIQSTDITTATNKLVQEHVREEAEAFVNQTTRIEKLSRSLIMVFSAIASLVIVLGAIHQHMTGSNLFASIGNLLLSMFGNN